MTMWRFVCVVAALSPLYVVRFSVGTLPMTVLEVLIIALAFVTAFRASCSSLVRRQYARQLRRIPKIIWISTAILLCAATIAVFVSPHLRAALGIWKAYFVEAIIFGLCAWLHLERDEDLFELAVAFSVSAFFISAYAVVQKITGIGIPNPFWRASETRRVTSIFGYPNAVGLFLEIMPPFLVAAAWYAKKLIARVWFVGCAVLALCAIYFAQSSGALAALVIAGGITLLRFQKTRVPTILCGVIALCIIALSPLRTSFANEFLLQGFSGQLRVQMWRETVQMLRARPLFGAGLAAYQTRVAPYHTNKRVEIYLYPHNLALTLWSEVGVLGIAAFVAVFCAAVWYSWRNKTMWGYALTAVFVIWFVHGLVDTPFFKNDLAALFFLLVAVAGSVRYTEPRS